MVWLTKEEAKVDAIVTATCDLLLQTHECSTCPLKSDERPCIRQESLACRGVRRLSNSRVDDEVQGLG